MEVTKLVVGGAVTLSGLALAWCAVAAPMGELIRTVDRWARPSSSSALAPEPVAASTPSRASAAQPSPSQVSATPSGATTRTAPHTPRRPAGAARVREKKHARTRVARAQRNKPARRRGPTNVAPPPTPAPKAPRSPRVLVLDRNAPPCDEVYVYIVSDWVDGGAMATIAQGHKSEGRLVRVGSRFAGYEVIDIGLRGNGLGPAVWLMKRDQICQARLFADNPSRARHRKRTPTRRNAKRRRR